RLRRLRGCTDALHRRCRFRRKRVRGGACLFHHPLDARGALFVVGAFGWHRQPYQGESIRCCSSQRRLTAPRLVARRLVTPTIPIPQTAATTATTATTYSVHVRRSSGITVNSARTRPMMSCSACMAELDSFSREGSGVYHSAATQIVELLEICSSCRCPH